MIDVLYIALPLIGFLAFYIKGMMGIGTSTVLIALSTFFIDPKSAIVMTAFVNIFGGLAMIKIDPAPLHKKFWIPIAAIMALGSIIGATVLNIVPAQLFQVILGIAFLIASFWFLFFNAAPSTMSKSPKILSFKDALITGFSGFCGGFIGITAPPLILHFGKYLNKQLLRRLFVLLFLPAAVVQTVTFWVNGLLTKDIIILGLLIIPFLAVGIYFGNRSFQKISETLFKRILGLFLIIVSARLIWFGL